MEILKRKMQKLWVERESFISFEINLCNSTESLIEYIKRPETFYFKNHLF